MQGNILSIVNTKAGETQNFTYDSLERLQTTQLSTDLYPTEYTYDATGNILSEMTFAGTTSYILRLAQDRPTTTPPTSTRSRR